MNVAFLVFNRPDLTELSFETIRKARPDRLLVVADGPRSPEEQERCPRVRELATAVDWPCEVLTNFSDTNLGCRTRIGSGLDWVFSQVEACIIVEDDCLPDPSFYHFAQAALERYWDDPRIGMVSGNNHGDFQSDRSVCCHFSRHSGIWGWATWRRAWKLYEDDISAVLPELPSLSHSVAVSRRFRRGWSCMVQAAALGELDTWDSAWVVALARRHLLTVRPVVNLVANIGQNSGTNCNEATMPEVYRKCSRIAAPLVFPEHVAVDGRADRGYEREWARIMTEPWSLRMSLIRLRWRLGALIRQTLLGRDMGQE